MISVEGLEYDIQISDLDKHEQQTFEGEVLQVAHNEVIVEYHGLRVLLHKSDLEKLTVQ